MHRTPRFSLRFPSTSARLARPSSQVIGSENHLSEFKRLLFGQNNVFNSELPGIARAVVAVAEEAEATSWHAGFPALPAQDKRVAMYIPKRRRELLCYWPRSVHCGTMSVLHRC